MKNLSRSLAALAAAGISISLAPAPAHAAYKAIDVGPVSMGTSMHCFGGRASLGDAWVTLNGDYVTVRDHCADGNPVRAVVQMQVNGTNTYWYCTNSSGSGTVKVCDFDWPEGYVGFKTVIFYAWDGIREYKMGTLRHWRDG